MVNRLEKRQCDWRAAKYVQIELGQHDKTDSKSLCEHSQLWRNVKKGEKQAKCCETHHNKHTSYVHFQQLRRLKRFYCPTQNESVNN